MQNKEKKKTPTEKETRQKLITAAKLAGCEDDLLKIFVRYDDLQKGAKSQAEREAIGVMGLHEINALMNTHRAASFVDHHGQNRVLTYNGKVAGKN